MREVAQYTFIKNGAIEGPFVLASDYGAMLQSRERWKEYARALKALYTSDPKSIKRLLEAELAIIQAEGADALEEKP